MIGGWFSIHKVVIFGVEISGLLMQCRWFVHLQDMWAILYISARYAKF
ncbi:MAG: hypothetical protein FD170_3617 [Bacteroidetes bacterium]|nr:MAG: hypothetical protein FD170_3617 [Bacteroidota bacterium]